MSRIISASINLEKIDKSKITTDKQGKGKYYPVSIIVNDTVNQYGNDTSISTGQTKEEREAKAKKTYLGNGKTVWRGDTVQSPVVQTTSDPNDDLPF